MQMHHHRRTLLVMMVVAACDPGMAPEPGAGIAFSFAHLPALDAMTEGTYTAWVVDPEGRIHSVGSFTAQTSPTTDLVVSSPVTTATHVFVTVEPPGDADDKPSLHTLLGGRFANGIAALDVTGYLTIAGVPLESQPGTHVLGTPSNDGAHGKPSAEDSGLWLYNLGGDTLDGSFYLNFTPLTAGWAYEGWIVRDHGASAAIWISYGKFRPDGFRQANSRDDTGLGPYSGRRDYEFALALDVRYPGDDWLDDTVGVPVPGGIALPLDLNGDAAVGVSSRWTHVITIEPWEPLRTAESPGRAQPFFLRPYRNPVGEAGPAVPRTIVYVPDALPSGTANLRP